MKVSSITRGLSFLTVAVCVHPYSTSSPSNQASRRDVLQRSFAAALLAAHSSPVSAATGPQDGNLPDLPPEAVRSYLQYRVPLQTSADFYLFELRELLTDTSEWGIVGELFQTNNNRGQGNPSRMEREFTNTFRIIGLSLPPDEADAMREAQFKFEKAAQRISKTTAGIRRDLPVEIDPEAVPQALKGWEEGRMAINLAFAAINEATGLNELRQIPAGPNSYSQYGRSQRRYLDLKKKIKLCQNRGGPTLSQAWGQLMVSGYMQDSCGIPDLEAYFYQ